MLKSFITQGFLDFHELNRCPLWFTVCFNNPLFQKVSFGNLEVFKPAPVHFFTDFPSTASATVSTYGRVVLRLGTFLQAFIVVQDSHLLNTHPHPQPTRATLPSRHSFAGKYRMQVP
ncbi:hypothetical protein RF11_14015 [Thelohanellus kitauei]|uniref:Uncharacterized protein n=1 Tax=Thelohanellus kitauei TaxID=669202 RepID=A0A0C2IBA3_THEKT|nr:hypothetical protein RF11_14015 [Thelohanellus kitauei]